MNGKQAKRLRGVIRRIAGTACLDRKHTTYTTALVDSDKGYSVTVGKGTEQEQEFKDKAILVRLTAGVPRQVLKGLKQRVQTDRRA